MNIQNVPSATKRIPKNRPCSTFSFKVMYSISFWFCQDDSIKRIVDKYGTNDWKLIANHFSDRSDIQCQHRWYKVLNPELIKGPWTKEVCFSYYICVLIMPILFGGILYWSISTRWQHIPLKFVRCHHSYQ